MSGLKVLRSIPAQVISIRSVLQDLVTQPVIFGNCTTSFHRFFRDVVIRPVIFGNCNTSFCGCFRDVVIRPVIPGNENFFFFFFICPLVFFVQYFSGAGVVSGTRTRPYEILIYLHRIHSESVMQKLLVSFCATICCNLPYITPD